MLIDGVDLRDVALDSLRANLGVVFQESMLFYRSIADNLRVGRPAATEAELLAAARMAEAHDFILRQPDGHNTLVGERGATLSGGERRRSPPDRLPRRTRGCSSPRRLDDLRRPSPRLRRLGT